MRKKIGSLLSDNPVSVSVANSFRAIVSGSPDGAPDWVSMMAIGDDEGYFGPQSAVWQVHGNIATLVGGIRALLLQAAHPAALKGVSEHSTYESDPLGRLERTTRWLTVTTFGSSEAIAIEARRVNELHKRVNGTFKAKSGGEERYDARDPRFLLWVHCAFTDAFLTAHEAIGAPLPQGADQYVAEWSKSALALGLKIAPMSKSELAETMNTFLAQELCALPETEKVVNFILNPPFGRVASLFYKILANGAIYTLDEPYLKILGIKKRSRFWLHLARLQLKVLGIALGGNSPSQKIALQRIERNSM